MALPSTAEYAEVLLKALRALAEETRRLDGVVSLRSVSGFANQAFSDAGLSPLPPAIVNEGPISYLLGEGLLERQSGRQFRIPRPEEYRAAQLAYLLRENVLRETLEGATPQQRAAILDQMAEAVRRYGN